MSGVRGTFQVRKPAQPLSFRWAPEFIARIDAARGEMPRSAFVRQCVEERMTGLDELAVEDAELKHPPVRPSARDTKVKPKAKTAPAPLVATKTCGSGCVVPVGTVLKRCVRHGLVLSC